MKILKCERKGAICSELKQCRRMEVVEVAVQNIREGGLLVYPTDTLLSKRIQGQPFKMDSRGQRWVA